MDELRRLLDAMPAPAATANVDQLEAELASTFGASHAVAVSSGTAALHCTLAALRIGPGDEVLMPAVSVVMSAAQSFTPEPGRCSSTATKQEPISTMTTSGRS